MTRYFFDLHENGRVMRDEEGAEFDGLAEAWREAACTLGEMARDALRQPHPTCLTIAVRDATRPRLRAELRFTVTEL